jgi:hypothetical protein
VKRFEKIWKKGKFNYEKIWKIWRKGKLNIDKIWTILYQVRAIAIFLVFPID